MSGRAGDRVEGESGPQSVSLRSRPYYMLLLLAALMAIPAVLLTLAFFFVYKVGTQLIWETLPEALGFPHGTESALFTIAFCVVGGLIVGLITYYTREKPDLLQEEIQEFQENGRMKPRHGLVGMIRGLVGLIFAASIGPEGPLTGGTAGLGTWIAEKRKMPKPAVGVATYASISGFFGAFLTNPFPMALLTIESGLEKGKLSWMLLIPGVVAASVGYVVFFVITGSVFGPLYLFPSYGGLEFIQLLYAVLLGLVGGLVGLLFIYVFKGLRRAVRPWKSRPIQLGLLGGLILGVLGAIFPLTLFDGGAETQELINQAAELGIVMLIVLALVKIFLTSMCLSFGYSGGYIFPSFFIGASMGLAIHLLLPFIPDAVCVACVMGAVGVVLLRTPITMTFIVQALFDVRLAPVIAIAIVTAFILSHGISLVGPSLNKETPSTAPQSADGAK